MRHARAEALDQLEPLLTRIRAYGALKEKSRGIFYRGSKAFLHFHEDPAGLFVDIRGANPKDFDRFLVDAAGETEVLARVAALAHATGE